MTCNATYLITQADLDTGSVTNIATGHAQTLGGTPVNSNNASATVNAEKKPALAIDKTAQETTYDHVGDVIHYSYQVTNAGNITLHERSPSATTRPLTSPARSCRLRAWPRALPSPARPAIASPKPTWTAAR